MGAPSVRGWRSATATINDAEDSLTASRTVTDQAETIIKMDEADGLRSGDVDGLKTALDRYLQGRPAVPSIDTGDWKTMLALPLTAGETKTEAAAAKTAGSDGLHTLQAELETATKSCYTALRAKIASTRMITRKGHWSVCSNRTVEPRRSSPQSAMLIASSKDGGTQLTASKPTLSPASSTTETSLP